MCRTQAAYSSNLKIGQPSHIHSMLSAPVHVPSLINFILPIHFVSEN